MKAIVLSGGSGTRLRPISHAMAKQLVPVANTPLLGHVLANVRALGITEVGVVVGHWRHQIEQYLGDGRGHGVRITYIHQREPEGLAHCVRLARPFLGDEDFLLYLGDVLLSEPFPDVAAEFRRHRPAASVLVQKVGDPRTFGTVELGPAGDVRRLVEKPSDPSADLVLIGVYFFTPAIHRAVDAIAPSARGELEITDAIQWLVDTGAPVRATRYTGFWRDTGSPQDVLECNRQVLGALHRRVEGDVDAASRLTGAVVVAPGAVVRRSRLTGPLAIAAGAVVEDSRIGPDVAIGRDCRVLGATLGDCIVMDGAVVRTPAALRGCVIGRGAVVAPAATPAHHRLLIGDHSRVELGS